MSAIVKAVAVFGLMIIPTVTVVALKTSTDMLSEISDEGGDNGESNYAVHSDIHLVPPNSQNEDGLKATVTITDALGPEDTTWQEIIPSYTEPSPLPAQGLAMYYNPGVMERVLKNRQESGRVQSCHECIGYVAMLRYGDLNRRVWIKLPDGTIEGPFWVIDVAATKHVGMLIDRGWIVDVDYETSRRWHMNNPMPVTLLDTPPPSLDEMVRVRPGRIQLLNKVSMLDIYRSTKMNHMSSIHEHLHKLEGMHIQ